MRPYPRFGGESVSFAKTSLALHILYYLYLLLSPLRLLYGSSGLRFAQTCAPCAFENAQVCDPTLSATKKKSRSGSFSVAERVGFEPTKPFMGAYTISSRARSTGLRHLSSFGCLSIIHYFTPIVKRLS